LWVSPSLPAAFQEGLPLPPGFARSAQSLEASLRLEVGSQSPVSAWVYALAAPFPTLEEGVSFKALRRCWQGDAAGPFAGSPLLVDESTLGVFSALWGAPAAGAVKVLESGKLLNTAWRDRPAWALLPFESLGPRWKVLEVDGQSPVRKAFDPVAYPLVVPISLVGPEAQAAALRPLIPSTNRDPGKLTTVVMTGVTALVRATAYLMERDGITSPAEYIGDWLQEADILHISNEIPFAPNCPFPDPQQPGLRFCSAPRYMKLLEEIGTDVVELTGDHFADWGAEATLYTLDMYRERGWPYYGGGENIEDGRKPVTFEHNGNRIAFIGCNGKGGGYATARENAPGAVACDYEWMHAQITRLRKRGFLPIATFQHVEVYAYNIPPDVRDDFVSMAEAGAVIVSGSQAHQPHGMEFAEGAFIHFGLGNLFFDQYRFFAGPETDRAFIDRHVFYDGRYISTELLTMYFVDLSHGRPMTPEERTAFLEQIFRASGW
jgi:poly-gamma-glutamate synthesis protein (capsule biosynthesis protein)